MPVVIAIAWNEIHTNSNVLCLDLTYPDRNVMISQLDFAVQASGGYIVMKPLGTAQMQDADHHMRR